MLWIDNVLSFASVPSLTIIRSATVWWIHHERHGGAILWGLLSLRPYTWCQRNSCSAKCPKKLRTCPTRRAQWPKRSSYSERTGGYILIHKKGKSAKIINKSYFKVLDCSCKGIGGALVEVWYAGGNPGLPKSLSAIGVAFHTYSLIVLLSWLGASCHPVTL